MSLFRIIRSFRLISLYLLFCLCIFIPTIAHSAVEDEKVQVEDLLLLSGMMQIIDDIPVIMNAGIEQKKQEKQSRGKPVKKYLQLVEPAIKEHFSRKAMLQNISKTLDSLLNGQRPAALRNLLNSSLAKQIVEMKRASRTQKSTLAIKNMADDHDLDNISKERLALLEEFDNATADTEFFVAVQALSIESILKLNNAYSIKTTNKSISGLDGDVLSSTYNLLLRPSRYSTMMTYRHMFRDSSEGKIRQYITLYRQSHFQWLLKNTMVAISEAMNTATTRAIKDIHGG